MNFNSILGHNAGDLSFVNLNDFYEVIGYLAKPNKITNIHAEVPQHKINNFTQAFPGQPYLPITPGFTKTGNPKKYSFQFRIYISSTTNCPPSLLCNFRAGMGYSIDKSRFVEKIVRCCGFNFGSMPQNATVIRANVPTAYHVDFDRGYNL